MGQEIHRKGLITSSEVHGTDVSVTLAGDPFSVAMLRMHLQVDYPGANILTEDDTLSGGQARITIRFDSQEDAMHFHLRH